MLLGADIFSRIILPQRMEEQYGDPFALNILFGYVLMDKVAYLPYFTNTTAVFCQTESLETSVKQLWELEAVPEVCSLSPEDHFCEKLFADSCKRDSSGRFVVLLSFRNSLPTFPDSHSLAVNVLQP